MVDRDLNDLLIFAEVVSAGSFTAAAKGIGVPTSTVSRRVARLEDRLGARLLQRTTRKINLTDAGRVLYDRGIRILSDVEDAERAVLELQAVPRGRLRVTAPTDLGVTLTPLILDFMEAETEVEVDLELTDRIVNLVEEGFDVAIRGGKLADSSLVAHRLARGIDIQIVAHQSYLERRGVPQTIHDLKAHWGILFIPWGSSSGWVLSGPDGEVTVPIKSRLTVNHVRAVKRAVQRGFGLGLLPVHTCAKDLEEGRMQIVLPEYRRPTSSPSVVYPSRRHVAPKVRAFVDYLKAHVEQVLPQASP